jgi:hypothetical protein
MKVNAIMKKYQRNTFFVLSAFAVLFLGSYGYFVNKTVWNVVERQNVAKEIQKTSSEVAVLEASYMALSGTLTLDHAYALGFQEVETKDTLFVERQVPAVAIR